jgi:hypothetical protein
MQIGKSLELDVPNGNSSVWRYTDLEKFRKLIVDRSLFFCNASRLSDQYEVTIPDSTVETWRQQLAQQGYSKSDVEVDIEIRLNGWQQGALKDLTLINCWSVTPDESYALWKIYLGGKADGVAIRTTASRLKRAIQQGDDPYPETVFIGRVRYHNHIKNDELSRFRIVTTKKTFYRFEEELRLFILNYPLSEGGWVPSYDIAIGRNVKVDLSALIQKVYISPFATESMRNEVNALLLSANLPTECIRESEIRDK